MESLDDFLRFYFLSLRICGSLQNSLLCIVGELTGGDSVTVAVDVSDW